MNCEVCSRQINGDYSHNYYIDYDRKIYVHEYDDYSKSSSQSKDDVMVCINCYLKNDEEISIPSHIPEQQYKKYLITLLGKGK